MQWICLGLPRRLPYNRIGSGNVRQGLPEEHKYISWGLQITFSETETIRLLTNLSLNNNPEEALQDQFVLSAKRRHRRERILDQAQVNATQLTIARAVSIVKNFEATQTYKNKMTKDDSRSDEIFGVKSKMIVNKGRHNWCSNCWDNHPYKACPAYVNRCHWCHRLNHYNSKLCRHHKQMQRLFTPPAAGAARWRTGAAWNECDRSKWGTCSVYIKCLTKSVIAT